MSESKSEEIVDKKFVVKVISDFRNFKKDEEFSFFMPVTVIVGENGSGKSSLVQAIRGKYPEIKNNSLFKNDFIKLAQNVEIETSAKHFVFFDSVKDDGSNMMNSYDAVEFIQNGGIYTQKMSHGETQLYHITRILKQIEEIRKNSLDEIILILDEFDKGFSLTNQSKVINVLYNINNKFNCKIICISHNYLLIDKIGMVYDLDKRDYILSTEYLEKFKDKKEKPN